MSPSNSKPSSPVTINSPSVTSSEVNPPMPATPPSPSSPRAVHFPTTGSEVTGSSRTPTVQEAWSFHHFENHARTCHHCYLPYDGYKVGHRLCIEGCNLASDTLRHVYRHDGHVYSTARAKHPIRVEIDKGYRQVRQVLKLVEKHGMSVITPSAPSSPKDHGKRDKKHKDKHHRHGRNDSGTSGYIWYSPMTGTTYAAYDPQTGYQTVDYKPSSPTSASHGDRHGRSPTRPVAYPPRDPSTAATVGSRDGYYIQDFVPASSSSKKHGKSRRH
ncbi:hypothetical protein K461DRAFT_281753 [Myriangium duriaei CBS 260.36]|uniref:Uncharacterized protein n=1 Tax=Myriangium duriaei CBS 260.36 TaxID=1168546 RepID=A0A9P4IX07_9PEZI|nr:hypothetical protein K461DRAFT_281753 [Myriangium duriaei CBS 260.36]